MAKKKPKLTKAQRADLNLKRTTEHNLKKGITFIAKEEKK